jgi:hypothetical protein
MTSLAENYFKQHKFPDAATLYEAEAEKTRDIAEKVLLYNKAASAYHEYGSPDDEVRCLLATIDYLQDEANVQCLVSCWKVYIRASALYQYETSFEWKGENENLDPQYGEIIEGYLSKSVDILERILRSEKLDRNSIREELALECVKMQNEGGWGVDQCWASIKLAWREK